MAEKTFKPQVKNTDGTMIDIKIPSTSVDGIDNYATKDYVDSKIPSGLPTITIDSDGYLCITTT